MSETNGQSKAMENLAKMDNLPNARLPQVYENAKLALRECVRIDECKDWADKAAALASYAKQANDEEMYKMAMRIRVRAVARCGELIDEIPAEPGKRTDLQPGGGASPRLSPREQAAKDAGMSDDQYKTAVRVHRVATDDPAGFEEQIDGANPPSVTELAKQGTEPRPPKKPLVDKGERTTEEFKQATGLIGLLEHILRQGKTIDISLALRGCDETETRELIANIGLAIQWLKTLENTTRKRCTPIKT